MAEESSEAIIEDGFSRIERDDRLLDVFPKETLDKGVQLYEKWTDTEVKIIRVHLKNITKHVFPRTEIEKALKNNKRIELRIKK
ncbi:MAG: hypothetical protein ABIP54_04775 [Candidatus Andersenbacteria bacterium]